MDRRIVAAVVVFVALVGMAGIGYAMCGMCPGDAKTGSAAQGAVEVGNTVCPVSGEAIEEASKATYEYKGKVYNLCCAACVDPFKKNPQSYIAKIDAGTKEAPAEGSHEGHPHSN